MNNYPKLSIVVPTYNRENYLKDCLDSIINQNYPNLEIVITDDNSTDDTENICKEYMKKFPYIKYVKNRKYPQGPNGNKNNGLDYTTGEIIGIFDDDDTLNEGVLIEMVDKILEGYDVVMGNCKIVSNRRDNGEFAGLGLNEDCEVDWKDYMCGKISGEYWSVFKKDVLGDKRFDIDLYGGEGILWMEVLKNKRIFYIHKAVRNYRVHNQTVMKKFLDYPEKALKNYELGIKAIEKYDAIACVEHLSNLCLYAAMYAKLSGNLKVFLYFIYRSIKYKISYKNLLLLFIPKQLLYQILRRRER